MKLRLTLRAATDLSEIADYIRRESPGGALRVRAAILQSLDLLAQFPKAGRLQSIEDVRKLVVRRYPYLVYYRISEAGDEILVLTIQHPAKERVFFDV
jgi:plasmid stabilization system protein ParE